MQIIGLIWRNRRMIFFIRVTLTSSISPSICSSCSLTSNLLGDQIWHFLLYSTHSRCSSGLFRISTTYSSAVDQYLSPFLQLSTPLAPQMLRYSCQAMRHWILQAGSPSFSLNPSICGPLRRKHLQPQGGVYEWKAYSCCPWFPSKSCYYPLWSHAVHSQSVAWPVAREVTWHLQSIPPNQLSPPFQQVFLPGWSWPTCWWTFNPWVVVPRCLQDCYFP